MRLPVARLVNRRIQEIMCLVGLGAIITFVVLSMTISGGRQALSGIAFGASLFCCSLCSFFYDVVERPSLQQLFRLLDHSAIFLLIAGTYTPFVIFGVAGPFGIGLLTWIWGLAIIGICLKLVLGRRYDKFFIPFYLALGWLIVAGMAELITKTPALSLAFLAAGGMAYTLGALIFWFGRGRWIDAIWHSFVLTGFLLHFAAVLSLSLMRPEGSVL